jgi:hypothetical protein
LHLDEYKKWKSSPLSGIGIRRSDGERNYLKEM